MRAGGRIVCRLLVGAAITGLLVEGVGAARAQTLLHRYSFTTDGTDSVGGANATLYGGAFVQNGALQLNGSGAYAQLSNGILSNLDSVSIETWLMWTPNGNWARIFDFGSGTNANLFMTPSADPSRGGTPGSYGGTTYAAITTSGNGSEQRVIDGAFPTNSLVQAVFTLDSSTHTGSIFINGILVAQNSNVTLRPADMGYTTDNYLGKSQYADPTLKGSITEFRIYSGALSAAQVQTNFQAGADRLTVPEPGVMVTAFSLLGMTGLGVVRGHRRRRTLSLISR